MSDQESPALSELSIYEQADRLRDQSIKLFIYSDYHFGATLFGGGESYDAPFRDKIRHRAGDSLITVSPYEYSLDGPISIEPSVPVSITVETPLPSTATWPNSYVQETFAVGPVESRIMDGAFDYELGIAEYAQDGRKVTGQDSASLKVEKPEAGSSIATVSDPVWEQELATLLDSEPGYTSERKIDAIRRTFPEIMQHLTVESSPIRFRRVLEEVIGLSPTTEVGCLPNPYIRI